MKTKKQKNLLQELKTIPDYRVDTGKIEYPLHEVLFMSLIATIKGHSTYNDMTVWMKYNSDNKIIKRVLQKDKINIPSSSTLHNILINTDNNALEEIFRKFASKHIEKKNIAIDGKWLRGSDVNGQYTKEGHKAILNILDKDSKIVFAHKFLDKDKKSEIKAFQELLDDGFFSSDGQIFSFDALLTQVDILNTIDTQGNRYIAKLKDNQLNLKSKAIDTANSFKSPIYSYDDKKQYLIENNKLVSRKVEVFQNRDCDLVMHHERFNNIQSIIKVTKTLTDQTTKETTTTEQYLIANFKTDAKDFKKIILEHWKVETYHYHLDMLTKEDDHIAYKNPYSIAILRSWSINLYQLFLNDNKDKKVLLGGKTTMAEIKRSCMHSDDFIAELLERYL
jgi:predicted transposase YbfD/YdcC